jgi:Temperature dependent protein affecting M2 dsRNA replication
VCLDVILVVVSFVCVLKAGLGNCAVVPALTRSKWVSPANSQSDSVPRNDDICANLPLALSLFSLLFIHLIFFCLPATTSTLPITSRLAMPIIRGLEHFLRQKKLIYTAPLHTLTGASAAATTAADNATTSSANELQNTADTLVARDFKDAGGVLAIDAVQWFRNSSIVKDEPLHGAIGGPLLAIESHMESSLSVLAGVKPVFVFGGLIPPKQPALQHARGLGTDQAGGVSPLLLHKDAGPLVPPPMILGDQTQTHTQTQTQDSTATTTSTTADSPNTPSIPEHKSSVVVSPALSAISLSSAQVSTVSANSMSAMLNAATQNTAHKVVSKKHHKAWQAYEDGNANTAAFLFKQIAGYASLEVQSQICTSLQRRGITYFRAPYSAGAQLAWMSADPQPYASAVYGGLELLLYGVQTLILSVDTTNNTFEWVSLPDILQHLELDFEQFVDMSLLAGYGNCRTFPPLLDQRKRFFFSRFFDAVTEFGSGLNVIDAHMGNMQVIDLNYRARFNQTRFTIKHCPIVRGGNQYSPLHIIPSDETLTLSHVFGTSLPPALNVLLVKDVISPRLLNNALNGMLVDSAPSVECTEYVGVLNALTPTRCATFTLLADSLQRASNGAMQPLSVVNKRWYDKTYELKLFDSETTQEVLLKLPQVRLLNPTLAHAIGDESKQHGCLNALVLARYAAEHNTPVFLEAGVEIPSTYSADLVLHSSMMVVLQLLGYAQADGTLTSLGETMAAVATNANATHEALFMTSVLIRIGAMHGRALTLVDPEGHTVAFRHDDNYGRENTIVSRLACLLSFPLAGKAWSGSIDRRMSGFHGIIKAVHRSVRSVYESALISVILQHAQWSLNAERTRVLRSQMPFGVEPSCTGGLIVHELIAESDDETSAPVNLKDRLEQTFPELNEDTVSSLALCVQLCERSCEMMSQLSQKQSEIDLTDVVYDVQVGTKKIIAAVNQL